MTGMGDILFEVNMRWGAQPVRLTAHRSSTLPVDAPTTSVHLAAFHGGRLLVVCDRKGVFGFPGGRLEPSESYHDAMVREVYEEACAHVNPGYELFAAIRIECTEKIPGRSYPHDFSYMGLYTGTIRALEPIRRDPAGIVTSRSLFTALDCSRLLLAHDRILLTEAIKSLARRQDGVRIVKAFLNCELSDVVPRIRQLREGSLP